MIPKNIAFLLLCLCTTLCFAQDLSVSGTIVDTNNVPIELANVVLFDLENSEVVKGASTDVNGFFSVNNLSVKAYIVKISFMGFKTYEQKLILTGNLDLKTIQLEDDVDSLDEVTITVKKPTLKREVDRLVFNVENTALSEGNLMDVLRSTPGVLVLDNSISVKNGSPTVYINDRKVHLTMAEVVELLQSTPASNIKSIEVITNPPARYDADSGSVLNIVMSKNLVTGYSGSLFSNYTQGVFPKRNHGMSNFFKTSKLNVYTNYSYSHRKVNRTNKERIDYLDNNSAFDRRWITDFNRNTWSETHNISANIDYDFDDKNQLSFSSNISFLPYFKYRTKSETDITPADADERARYTSLNLSRDKKRNLGFNLDYSHSFDNESKLSFGAHTTIYDYRRKQGIESSFFLGDGSLLESNAFNTRSDQTTDILSAQVDYTLPLNETSSFETGIKFSNVETGSTIIQRNIIGGQEVIDPDNTDAFDYDENVFAAYASYKKEWEKWNLSLGVRAEQTNVEGLSMLSNESNTQDYLEFFPSANVLHTISDNFNAYANYNRRIQRPNYSSLNPFQFFLNDNTVVTGNPNLQPIFIDYFALGTTFKDNYTFELNYKKSTNSINEVPLQNNDTNVITYTPINIGETSEFAIDFLAYFDIGERWTSSFLTSTYYTEDRGVFNNSNVQLDKWANYSEWSNNFTFLKDNSLTLNFVLTYSTSNLQGFQVVDKGQLYSDVSIRKTMLKGKGILSLTASDLFNDQDFFISTKFADQNNFLFTNLDNRFVRLGFRYKFGNTKLSTNAKALSKEERERLGNSN